MAIVALDVGKRRIGAAIVEREGNVICPLDTIERRSFSLDSEVLAELVASRGVERIVVGLPLNMDGTDGESARMVRAFAAKIEAALGVPVELYDERLTSLEAEDRLVTGAIKTRRRKGVIDAVAAAVILEGWLESHKRSR